MATRNHPHPSRRLRFLGRNGDPVLLMQWATCGRWRAQPSSRWALRLIVSLLAAALSTACSDSPTVPTPGAVGYEGAWAGTTDRGDPISFSVSSGQAVISLTFGYRLNGCAATMQLTGLSLQVREFRGVTGEVTQGFGYTSGRFTEPNYVEVMASFTAAAVARGYVALGEYGDCGNGVINWTATKR